LVKLAGISPVKLVKGEVDAHEVFEVAEFGRDFPDAPAVARLIVTTGSWLCMAIRETRWTHAVFGGVPCGTSLKGQNRKCT